MSTSAIGNPLSARIELLSNIPKTDIMSSRRTHLWKASSFTNANSSEFSQFTVDSRATFICLKAGKRVSFGIMKVKVNNSVNKPQIVACFLFKIISKFRSGTFIAINLFLQ